MSDLGRQVGAVARHFALGLGRPGVLQAVHRGRLLELKVFELSGEPVRFGVPSDAVDPLMRLLHELLDAADNRVVVAELRVMTSGEFEFGYSGSVDSLSPARVVVDAGYRYPGHPLPGMPAPRTSVNAGEPTDPGTLDTVRRLVEEYAARYTAIMGRRPQLTAGYSEAEIADAERRMGLRLPEELRGLYRVIHDDVAEHGVLGQYCLMPLDQVVATYLAEPPGSGGSDDQLFAIEPVVFESSPPGRVRRVSRNDWRVTIATDNSGNYCAVDLDPAEAGTPGQLIEYGRDIVGPVGYLAPSVTVLLGQVVDALRAGDVWEPDPDDARLRPHPPVGAGIGRRSHSWSVAVGDRDLAVLVAELGDRGRLAVQSAFLNDATDLDLAALAPLPNLRAISVNRAGGVQPRLPTPLPVESLSLQAKSADLDQIAGHPTIWNLTISGLAAPVDARQLATLPALAQLDVSGAKVNNEAYLANLTELRVLALNQPQWSQLRHAHQIPTRLAAAELSSITPLADAVEWATDPNSSSWWRSRSISAIASPPSAITTARSRGRRAVRRAAHRCRPARGAGSAALPWRPARTAVSP